MSLQNNLDDLSKEVIPDNERYDNDNDFKSIVLSRLTAIETRIAKLDSGITEDIQIDRENNADVSENSERSENTDNNETNESEDNNNA